MHDFHLPLSTVFVRCSGALAEMSEMPSPLPDVHCMLEEFPALDARTRMLCDALDLVDDTGGRATWQYVITVPDGVSVHVRRYDRTAAIDAGLRACAALSRAPLPCTGTATLIARPAPDMPAVMCAYTTLPDLGDLELWVAAATTRRARALLRRWAPAIN